MDRDEVLVKIVEHECIIWKRNHPQFKNVTMKEQAWQRVAYQLGISSESVSFFANIAHTQSHDGKSSFIVPFASHSTPCVFVPSKNEPKH